MTDAVQKIKDHAIHSAQTEQRAASVAFMAVVASAIAASAQRRHASGETSPATLIDITRDLGLALGMSVNKNAFATPHQQLANILADHFEAAVASSLNSSSRRPS